MAALRSFTTADASAGLLVDIRHLLVEAFDGDFSEDDWDHTLGGWHVLATDGDAVVSHVAVAPRVLEVAGRPLRTGYVECVATAPARRNEGLGSLVMAEASGRLRQEFEMGALSTGDSRFYERMGWERWQGPTFVRRGKEMIRTEEEDDGVMILRCGATADIDLTASISCEERRGDDW